MRLLPLVIVATVGCEMVIGYEEATLRQTLPYGSLNASCASLPDQCPQVDCCNDPQVSPGVPQDGDYRLGAYEDTVGRFGAFVEAYDGTPPPAGAGAHPLHPRHGMGRIVGRRASGEPRAAPRGGAGGDPISKLAVASVAPAPRRPVGQDGACVTGGVCIPGPDVRGSQSQTLDLDRTLSLRDVSVHAKLTQRVPTPAPDLACGGREGTRVMKGTCNLRDGPSHARGGVDRTVRVGGAPSPIAELSMTVVTAAQHYRYPTRRAHDLPPRKPEQTCRAT